MVDSRPTASVTGRQDWEWNRSRADPQPAAPARRSPTPERRPADRPHRARRAERADRTEVQALAAELERTQRRLDVVVTQYERLLQDRNRRLQAEREDHSGTRPVRSLVQTIRRLVANR